ncbi:uncharacterized protein LOC129987581 [Argiope bruennichi]|uniref:uncharacterized protein LOC129987581 n=1 Tax=Argiope bruennichi TaxID=94029 RepID=UPI00249534EA|nr:uncharacterized protein LOC129987581 [Argiope bruennichi]
MATAETAAVVIPPIIKLDPALWFHMLDSTLELASPKIITESKTKYKYGTQEIRRLLAGESLGARKPSELLRIMKRRVESHKIDDFLLFELFNEAMPVPVQTILVSISLISSEKAADVADRILDINSTSISTIFSGNERNSSPVKELKSDMDLLRNEIKEVRQEVGDLRRSRSRFRSSSSTRRARSNSGGYRYCWHHL